MPALEEVRQKYPQYADMPDQQLAEALHRQFYPDMSFEEFAHKAGYEIQKPSMLDRAVGGLEAAATIASGMIAEPAAGVAGAVTAAIPGLAEGSGAGVVEGVRDRLTYEPRTQEGQRYTQAIGEVVEPIAQAFDKAGEALGDTAFEATGSPAVAAAAETVPTAIAEAAGVASVKGVKNVRRAADEAKVSKAIEAAAPSVRQLKDASRAIYKDIDNMGVRVNGRAYRGLVSSLAREAKDSGLDPDITPKAYKALQRFTQHGNQPISLSELDTLRKVAQNAARSMDKADAAIGVKMISAIDDFLDNLDESALTRGTRQAAGDVGKKYKTARDLWGRARRSELVGEAFDKARNQASGFENGLRIQFRQILNNKKLSRFFNDEEKAAMQRVVRGDKTENLLRLVGKLGFSEGSATNLVGGSIGVAGGAAAAGPAGAVVVPLIGQVSKKLARRMTANNAEFADQVIRAGRDAKKITRAYFQNVKPSARSAEELSELLMRPDVDLDKAPKTNVIAIDAARIARQRRMEMEAAAVTGSMASQASAEEDN